MGRDARSCHPRTDVIKTTDSLPLLPCFRLSLGPGGLQDEFWTFTLTKLLLFFFRFWIDWDLVIFVHIKWSHLFCSSVFLLFVRQSVSRYQPETLISIKSSRWSYGEQQYQILGIFITWSHIILMVFSDCRCRIHLSQSFCFSRKMWIGQELSASHWQWTVWNI